MPGYDELVQRHSLSIFLGGQADWQLTSDGDLALTRDGDISIGGPAFNAMHRIVDAWRVNAPTMELLFDCIYQLRAARPQLETALERAHTLDNPWNWEKTPDQIAAFRAADDELDAADVGRASLSGSLILFVATLVNRFRSDLQPTSTEWESGRPDIGGVSIGRLIPAAANAFRHADEWAEARHVGTFSKQQKLSIDLLNLALKPDPFVHTDRPVWEVVLDRCSDGSFDQLAQSVLGFANHVALMVRGRLGR